MFGFAQTSFGEYRGFRIVDGFANETCLKMDGQWKFPCTLAGSGHDTIRSMHSASPPRLHQFDMRAFYAALDAARQANALSWAELAVQTSRPFEGTTSIPIHPATLRDMLAKRSVTSAVVLQALAWLGRTPESFLTGPTRLPSTPLPEAGPGRVLRFDTRALHSAVNAQRQERGLTWAQAAVELPGFTESMLTNLAHGPLIGFPRVMLPTQWVGQPAAAFVRLRAR
ncbi:hypothetical protein [Paraburkholderia silvatlantica]|uniref:hypothetical protein n=1 Tax=Paraburkholderia silvatlantica TaxID=321895 RepID=UPI0037511E8F